MSRHQLQESEATTTSQDSGVLATVLSYLKSRNLKGTEEALKRELGMQDDSSLTPRLAHSGTEPEKYEESYSSNAPSSSTPTLTTTRAELQLSTVTGNHHGNTPRSYIVSTTFKTSQEVEEEEDNEDTQNSSSDEDEEEDLEPIEYQEEEEDGEEEYSTMEISSSNLSTLRSGSRSLSWSGGIETTTETHSTTSRERQHREQEEEEVHSPSSGFANGIQSTADKSPLWARKPGSIFTTRSSTSSESALSPLQKQAHQQSVIIQGASTPTQIPINGPFFYQLATAPGQLFSSGSRQPLIAPILQVLPANASLVNPTLARTMNLNTSSQPIVLNAAQGLSLSPVSQQPHSLAQRSREGERSINLTSTEPTTGQAITSPLVEQAPIHTMTERTSPTRTLASIPLSELTPQYSELKAFAEEFKSKRIRLGFTQGAVGQSLADKGYSNFAQSTISRFEQMQLSPTNAAAIKQVLEKWLQEAENPEAAHSASSTSNLPFMASRKRKKRAVFTPKTRGSLDNFFKQNPRPNRQMIESIASQLDLLPEEVRVWFCNKRQKHKQHQTVYHYDQDLNLSTTLSSGANSPTSLYETKRNTPSPKTPFTIEELSKSSASTGHTSMTAAQLTSPFMSPTSLVMAVTTPKVFFNPTAPISTTAVQQFLPSSWSVAQTTA